jgi:hypothetical protein
VEGKYQAQVISICAFRRAFIVVALATAACGRSPTSPSEPKPPLPDGRFTFNWGGTSCNDVTFPQVGTDVFHRAVGSHDSSGNWIGHPETAADGTFEIRLRRADAANPPPGPHGLFDIGVVGTISGTANDSLTILPPPSERSAVFGVSDEIGGWVDGLFGQLGTGFVTGNVTISRSGRSVNCTGAGWLMNGPPR